MTGEPIADDENYEPTASHDGADPEGDAADNDLGTEDSGTRAHETAVVELTGRTKNAPHEVPISDWMGGSRRSSRLVGRDPDPNFGLLKTHDDGSDASFAAARTCDD